MNEVRYRVRLVLERNHADQAGYISLWVPRKECVLFDPAPDVDAAQQEFDDVLKTLDARAKWEEQHESDY